MFNLDEWLNRLFKSTRTLVITNQSTEEKKAKDMRSYKKEYRLNNKESIKEYSREYYLKNKEIIQERERKQRPNRREYMLAYCKNYYLKNKST